MSTFYARKHSSSRLSTAKNPNQTRKGSYLISRFHSSLGNGSPCTACPRPRTRPQPGAPRSLQPRRLRTRHQNPYAAAASPHHFRAFAGRALPCGNLHSRPATGGQPSFAAAALCRRRFRAPRSVTCAPLLAAAGASKFPGGGRWKGRGCGTQGKAASPGRHS